MTDQLGKSNEDNFEASSFVNAVAWIFIVISGFATFISILLIVMMYTTVPDENIAGRIEEIVVYRSLVEFYQSILENIEEILYSILFLSLMTMVSSIGLLKRNCYARVVFIMLLLFDILLIIFWLQVQASAFSFTSEFMGGNGSSDFGQIVLIIISIIKIFITVISLILSTVFGFLIRKLCLQSIKAEFV